MNDTTFSKMSPYSTPPPPQQQQQDQHQQQKQQQQQQDKPNINKILKKENEDSVPASIKPKSRSNSGKKSNSNSNSSTTTTTTTTTGTGTSANKRKGANNQGPKNKRKNVKDDKTVSIPNSNPNEDSTELTTVSTPGSSEMSNSSSHAPAGHRPVTSCTHCRQHKIKCNASERFPSPCTRCERMDLHCEIDPQFRPKKGSQIQSLKNDVDELRSKIDFLTRNEKLITQALSTSNPDIQYQFKDLNNNGKSKSNNIIKSNDESTILKTILQKDAPLLSSPSNGRSNSTPLLNDSTVSKDYLPPVLENSARRATEAPFHFNTSEDPSSNSLAPSSISSINNRGIPTSNNSNNDLNNNTSSLNSSSSDNKSTSATTQVNQTSLLLTNTSISEFNLGDVKISLEKTNELHQRFISSYLPYLPIMVSNNCIELYQQSQLLFWTVMLTACLSDPDPSLYTSLASLIKQLAIETCWIRTPRSTHIVQALLILGTWPLPNQKVLDDCSYRFIGLAKNLSLQLGLHRGEFISEFSRTQVSLPDAEKWRTRTWLAVFFGEQFWSSNLGLPPSLQTDFLLERARIDSNLPKNFRCLISLSIFQSKLISVMGLSVTSPDGLMEPKNRAGALAILERELERLAFKLQIDDIIIEIYYLYVKLMVCCFAFLPETPSEDQTKYVTQAYLSSTRIVTIISKLVETRQLAEYPIYVRQSVSMAALILFKLHLTPYLLPKYVDSARQSIVTVHRLFRNMLAAWKDVENDISRTATVLEKLNFVIITHPELFTDSDGIIVRMRSHLTDSLFYDLVWCIHEARRRIINENSQFDNDNDKDKELELKKRQSQRHSLANSKLGRKILPLPFYNQITKDDFTAITKTTPNGTTVTTLVPTDQALLNATANATANGLSQPVEINGIPLSMLEATGSIAINEENKKNKNNANNNISNNNNSGTGTGTGKDNTTTPSTGENSQSNSTSSVKTRKSRKKSNAAQQQKNLLQQQQQQQMQQQQLQQQQQQQQMEQQQQQQREQQQQQQQQQQQLQQQIAEISEMPDIAQITDLSQLPQLQQNNNGNTDVTYSNYGIDSNTNENSNNNTNTSTVNNTAPPLQSQQSSSNLHQRQLEQSFNSLPLARSSSSIAAGVKGMIPPPLFPKATSSNNTSNNNSNNNIAVTNDNAQNSSSNNNYQPTQAQLQQTQNSNQQAHQLLQQHAGIRSSTSPNTQSSNNSSLTHSPNNNSIILPNGNGTDDLSNPNLNPNLNPNNNVTGGGAGGSNFYSPNDQSFIDSIFQQQSANWIEGGDDFLGWFDMNMAPEF